MSARTRPRAVIAAIGGVSLAVAGFMAPGAYAADTIDGDVTVSNTETVQVLMDAAGKIDSQRVYEQLVLTGDGAVDIANPVSTKGLRNLDGFGGFDVRDGKARVKADVSGTKKYRSVSDFTKKLPLDIEVTYTLDGEKVDPGDVVGKSGDLEVRYRVTNTTGRPEDVKYTDGHGAEQSAAENVVIPMVGSLTTVLPSTFTKVHSAEANAAGDGRGGTQMSFTMTLIPPIGSATAEFGYTAKVKGAVIPTASLSALPVNPLESPSFKGGAASYKGGAETGADLTAGATTIDTNVLKLRDGATDLVSGILQLSAGANQLSAGLQNDAAPGARELAAGAGKLDGGADRLDAGAGKLAAGLADAKNGAPALLDGVAKLKAGAQKVDAGLTTLNAMVVPNLDGISAGAGNLIAAVNGPLSTNLDNIGGYADAASAAISASTTMDAAEKTPILQALGGAKQTAQGVKAALKDTTPGTGFMFGLGAIKSGADQLSAGVDAQTSPGAAATDGTLKNGLAQLIGGLGQLSAKGGELIDGLGQLSAGADQLRAGTGDLQDGTGQLADGAGTLADGLGTAASGSGQLADGLNQAAEGAPELPEGADRLSKEGTSKLIEAGDETASDYGLKYALIEAGAARAASAQPYGSPEGATALTAYKFEIAGADGAGSANLKRGIAAIVLMAGAGLFAAVRRRGLI